LSEHALAMVRSGRDLGRGRSRFWDRYADGTALGWRPEGDPKVEVIIRTRGGASIYSWTGGFSVRCADANRPLPPLSHAVPNDIAPNLFNSVGTVEISEYREPNKAAVRQYDCLERTL
jgi:hypothetical protein